MHGHAHADRHHPPRLPRGRPNYTARSMGGHGGLNILPQKSWNVYNRDNRQKVAEDEAKLAAEEAAVAREANTVRATAGLQKLRKRAKLQKTEAAPQEHVNLFYVEERAQGNLEHQVEQKLEDARLVARVMPDLQLDRSSREPAPWYSTYGELGSVPEPDVAPSAPPRQDLTLLHFPNSLMPPAASRGELKQRVEHKRHKHDKHDKHDKGHKRDKAHRHHKEHRDHSERKEHKRRRAPEGDAPGADDAALMQRLRRERQERERHEQHRARSVVAYGQPEEACRTADRTQQVAHEFLQKTGQVVSLKPRPPGGAYRASKNPFQSTRS